MPSPHLGWMSMPPPKGVSHFVLADGTAACSKLRDSKGVLRRAPFTRPFVPYDPSRHLCGDCLRLHPGKKCTCGRCSVVALRIDWRAR